MALDGAAALCEDIGKATKIGTKVLGGGGAILGAFSSIMNIHKNGLNVSNGMSLVLSVAAGVLALTPFGEGLEALAFGIDVLTAVKDTYDTVHEANEEKEKEESPHNE